MYISFICVKSPFDSVKTLFLMILELKQDDISFHFPHQILELEQDAILFQLPSVRKSDIYFFAFKTNRFLHTKYMTFICVSSPFDSVKTIVLMLLKV